jgi:serine/threonine protein kinase
MCVMQAMEEIDLTGRTVDHYEIVALIRGGAQGRVYRARDQRLKRDVAIKVLEPGGRAFACTRYGLIKEAQALSRLNHPHVPAVYDFVTDEDRDFMVMEFVAGATLQEVLTGGPLPASEVVRLGTQLARGLAAAHGAHIVHCDLKPANLKITSSGMLKILDFGIARRLPAAALRGDPVTTTIFSVAGTVPYMAPEVLRGEAADERSDIFSAGVVLYEMATACLAFPQRTLPQLIEAIQSGEVVPPSIVNPAVPLALERIIAAAMRKEPAARYQDGRELAAALEDLMPSGKRHAARARSRLSRWWHLGSAKPGDAAGETADQDLRTLSGVTP